MELAPNADGSYTIPGGSGYTKVNINPVTASAPSGSTASSGNGVCKYCGKVHPNNIWGVIVSFFHTIFYFFKHLFG